KVFDYYINYIDSYKRFFTQEDISNLEQYKLLIDDQVKANELVFFNASMEVLNARIKEVRGFYDDIITSEFDFNVEDQYELDADKRIFAADLKELKNTVPFKVSKLGNGHVIYFTDNTNFRAFWYGTNKLLMNAIFFGDEM
ncbi:MAG: hypothetical protein IIB06_08470, partial [Bacteroidetes bacterium]|nr:hypothetical protein [Bacteroidota bacterium]